MRSHLLERIGAGVFMLVAAGCIIGQQHRINGMQAEIDAIVGVIQVQSKFNRQQMEVNAAHSKMLEIAGKQMFGDSR